MIARTKVSGKLFILGEYAVLHGYSCVVSQINKYLEVDVDFSILGKDVINTPDVNNPDFINQSLKRFRERFGTEKKVIINTKSDLGNYGLGSSSAVTVSTIRALAELFKIHLSDKELFDLCYKVVMDIQKIGSGADLAVCIYGHTINFDGKNKKAEIIYKDKLPIIVGYSGNKVKTVELIKQVNDLNISRFQETNGIYYSIGKLVKKGIREIIAGDWKEVGKLMNENHKLLQKLEVSTVKLDNMVNASCKAGAYGAKLSGAGGGDCMIACVNENKRDNVVKAIEKAGGKVLNVQVGKR
jgi:mevalonate kinase